jgi:uncharacterized protein YeaO (DUF488 family)
MIGIKRVYEEAGVSDGTRILVDRLWPRGLSKDQAQVDLWLREVAPSNELRTWFGHEPSKWEEFRKRYFAELAQHPEAVGPIRQALARGRVTLLYGAKDELHNNAAALREFLNRSS